MTSSETTGTPRAGEIQPPIVVGVDGSTSSLAALRWAAQQAALTGASLKVVTTWAFPQSFGYPVAWPEDTDFSADAKAILTEAVEKALGAYPDIDITEAVVEGHPALVLVDESKRASLIVVGSRGHGQFAGMLLGSVSEFLATHAVCPVLIVRDGDEEGRA